jgi:NAD+ synthase
MADRTPADEALTRELAGDPEALVAILTRFIRDETERVGFERLIVGLSGGLDSALAATLAVRALGPGRVRPVLMPCGSLGDQAVADARLVTDWLGVESEVVDIEPMVRAYFDAPDAGAGGASPAPAPPRVSRDRRGNFMARQRMAVLYDLSMRDRALVLGTSNKSELLLGYGTLHGDLASALNPLGDLYKTQVRGVARHLGLPERIIAKPPTADLWAGQSDEEELGFTYDEVDRILYLLVDRRLDVEEIVEYGFTVELIGEVARRIRASQFKRRLPLIAKVSARTIGIDFRYARDWGT